MYSTQIKMLLNMRNTCLPTHTCDCNKLSQTYVLDFIELNNFQRYPSTMFIATIC